MLGAGLCVLSSAPTFASLYVFGRQRFLIPPAVYSCGVPQRA